jgi:hypothetical protein
MGGGSASGSGQQTSNSGTGANGEAAIGNGQPGDPGNAGNGPPELGAPAADNNSPTAPKPSESEVDQAARAAGLAIKRIQDDIKERGQVDPELLKELGWTEDELKSFLRRMQDQLQEREANLQEQREKSLSQKSFEEMLRSLGITQPGTSRDGSSSRDRDRQDTTIRKTPPPSRYRSSFEAYQRSLSGKK